MKSLPPGSAPGGQPPDPGYRRIDVAPRTFTSWWPKFLQWLPATVRRIWPGRREPVQTIRGLVDKGLGAVEAQLDKQPVANAVELARLQDLLAQARGREIDAQREQARLPAAVEREYAECAKAWAEVQVVEAQAELLRAQATASRIQGLKELKELGVDIAAIVDGSELRGLLVSRWKK